MMNCTDVSKCFICGSQRNVQILNKPEVRLWSNEGDSESMPSYPCILLQCETCGHVFEPMSPALDRMLHDVYESEHAQASTSLGYGNWGLCRLQSLFDKFEIEAHESALDIGCADGHLLKELRKKGVKVLTGIEPSLAEGGIVDGIMFIKGYVHKDFKLSQHYDMVFASNVFEHVRDINSLMDFCAKHLNPSGKLYFTVPNAERSLTDGDPGLFIHQHIHHFTDASLDSLCQRHGLVRTEMTAATDTFYVTAALHNGDKCDISNPFTQIHSLYEKRLDTILARVQKILSRGKVIVHGASNALNNILSWLGRHYEFKLVDNDDIKQGKCFFNKRVYAIDEIDLAAHDKVLVVPIPYFDLIKEDYMRRGFQGEIMSILPR